MATVRQMSVREEELQIEVERLKAWLHKIAIEAWKGTALATIEGMANDAILFSNCAAQPDWGHTEDWAALGLWPPWPPACGTAPAAGVVDR